MLVKLEAEQVTAVTDTEESQMCVSIANTSFEEMTYNHRWKHLKQYSTFTTGSFDHEIAFPTDVYAVDPWNLYYDSIRINYLEPESFLALTISRDTSESNITKINGIKVITDAAPQFFTSDNQQKLIFDAHDTSALTGANTDGIVYVATTTRKSSDSDVFNLPDIAFHALQLLCFAYTMQDMKGDDAGARIYFQRHEAAMARLRRNGRVIDTPPDIRKSVVSRRTFQSRLSPPRNTGNGWIW